MSRSAWTCANPQCGEGRARTVLGTRQGSTLWLVPAVRFRRDGSGLLVTCPVCKTGRTYWGRVAVLVQDERKSA